MWSQCCSSNLALEQPCPKSTCSPAQSCQLAISQGLGGFGVSGERLNSQSPQHAAMTFHTTDYVHSCCGLSLSLLSGGRNTTNGLFCNSHQHLPGSPVKYRSHHYSKIMNKQPSGTTGASQVTLHKPHFSPFPMMQYEFHKPVSILNTDIFILDPPKVRKALYLCKFRS